MQASIELNLAAGWVGIALGILGGLALGLGFRGEQWLGGYGSWRRRLLRLGHISFFGLGFLNLLFFLCARAAGWEGAALGVAAAAFVIGAAAMPVCCVLCAWRPHLTMLFAVPVLSLLAATLIVVWEVLGP